MTRFRGFSHHIRMAVYHPKTTSVQGTKRQILTNSDSVGIAALWARTARAF
jgi:hypothetical protein